MSLETAELEPAEPGSEHAIASDPARAAPSVTPLSLRTNFAWTFLGNVVYSGCQWGMLVVLAKLGSKEIVGQFALGLAVTAPVFMFSNLQLRAIQATDARGQYRFSEYLALRLLATTLGLLFVVGVCFAGGYEQATAWVILAVGFAKAIESVSDVIFGLLQHHERMDRIAVSMIFKGVLSLVALGTTMALTRSIFLGSMAMAAAWLAMLLSYDALSAARVGERALRSELTRVELRRLAGLTWLALPLGAVMMLLSLNMNVPRYVLERYLGEADLGIFAALSALMMAGNQVVAALGQSASPRLAKFWQSGERSRFYRLFLQLEGMGLAIGLAGIAVAWLLGRPLLTLIYSAEYAEHTDLLVWLMVAAAVSYLASFAGYAVTAARQMWAQLPILIAAVGATAGCSFVLVARWGLSGAACTLAISSVVVLLGYVAVLLRATSVRRCVDELE